MPHGAKRANKKKDVLRTPSGLGSSEKGNKHYRRPDEKKEIAPSIENPERSFRCRLRPHCAYAWNRRRR
jgi:hypothetical protein